MNRSDIRIKAYAVIRRGDEILVHETREGDGTLIGYRVPGGHVEFGEMSVDAVQREMLEECSAKITPLVPLPSIERTFTYNGQPYHEVIFCYLAEFEDKEFYKKDRIQAHEDNGQPFDLFWLDPHSCQPGLELFPTGLQELLQKSIK